MSEAFIPSCEDGLGQKLRKKLFTPRPQVRCQRHPGHAGRAYGDYPVRALRRAAGRAGGFGSDYSGRASSPPQPSSSGSADRRLHRLSPQASSPTYHMTHTFHRTLLDDDHLWPAYRTALGARIIPAPSNDAAPSHSPTLTPERLASALNPQPDQKALTTTRRCLTVVTRDRPIRVR